MAQSLKCNECQLRLRSVKEAQDHAEATGHLDFAEDVEQVEQLRCTECGKICRSQTEADLHSKRLGHNSFEDVTATASKPIDTEKEMAEAQSETMTKPAGDAAEEGKGEEMVPVEVDEMLLAQLLDMGFPENRAIRSLHFGGGDLDGAITWLAEHEASGGVDEPLLVPRKDAKPKLTPEQAKARAQELLLKAKQRREAEERERERQRELERVRMGKELAAVARAEEEAKLKRQAEERQREKEEAERAREAIRKKLEEDRRERRRQLGLPEELTPEELEQERQREREKAEEEAKRKLPVKPISKAEKMRVLLVDMKKGNVNDETAVKTAYKTLLKFVTNVATRPEEEKYRKIRLSNPAVQSRIGRFPEPTKFLEECGFKKDGQYLEIAPENIDRLVLQAAVENLNSAIDNPFFGVL